MHAYFAFDVGKTGGWALIFPTDGIYAEKVELGIMPLIGKGKGADYDIAMIKKLLLHAQERSDSITVGIEDVHAVQKSGASTAFQFGRSLGILEGLVTGLGLSYVKIYSKTWQNVAYQGVMPVQKLSMTTKSGVSTDTKAMSKIAAARLYPNVDLRKSERAETPHDGIADALLIAHYLKTKQL